VHFVCVNDFTRLYNGVSQEHEQAHLAVPHTRGAWLHRTHEGPGCTAHTLEAWLHIHAEDRRVSCKQAWQYTTRIRRIFAQTIQSCRAQARGWVVRSVLLAAFEVAHMRQEPAVDGKVVHCLVPEMALAHKVVVVPC